MPFQPWHRGAARRSLRVALIDDHEISRVACSALLRTEGVEVVGDLPLRKTTVETVLGLAADVVIIDLIPGDDASFALARWLRARTDAPAIVLTSSADPALFASRLEGMTFVAKADLCAGQLMRGASENTVNSQE